MQNAFGRPSPAMLVAIVALLAALGGTAVGKTVLNKKKAKKIANNQITKRAPGLSVASAKTADSAQPTAFAQVSAAGALNPANSKNVGSVTTAGFSSYCFSGLPFAPKGLQADLDFSDSANGNIRLGVGGGASAGCPSGTQAFVTTFTNPATPAPLGFFVLFYG